MKAAFEHRVVSRDAGFFWQTALQPGEADRGPALQGEVTSWRGRTV